MDKYLRPKDIKNFFNCSSTKAYDIIKSKSFPKIKIGKNYYIPIDSFKEWSDTYLYKEYKL